MQKRLPTFAAKHTAASTPRKSDNFVRRIRQMFRLQSRVDLLIECETPPLYIYYAI
jgi:hypothetical protein